MKSVAVLAALCAFAVPAAAQAPVMKDPPKLTVAAKLREEPSKKDPKLILRMVGGSGEAAYPDGAALQFGVRLKEDQTFIVRVQTFVTGGKWEVELPALGNDIWHGVYVCQVDWDPELQPPGINPKLPADKRGLNHAVAELKLGSDEEIRRDRDEVMGFYKARLNELHEIVDPLKTEFQSQKTAKDVDKWNKVANAARDRLYEMDRALANFRRKRRNVLCTDLFESLNNVILTTKDFGIDAYTAAVTAGISSGMTPDQVDKSISEHMGKLDKALAEVKAAPEAPKENPK
ncbi:MAG: hypothetical protein HYY18_17930 [Planctomycetes bacterium]|nr:hypothetical protein [Planctomycetota bacterium]